MKLTRTLLVFALIAVAAGASWLTLRTPKAGSLCLSGQSVRPTADGSPVVCATGTWKKQD